MGQLDAAIERWISWLSRKLEVARSTAAAITLILIWAAFGPAFHYSDSWQLVVNTGTTVVNFIIGFVLLNVTARGMAALHAKIDELIRVTDARNELMAIETATSVEIAALRCDPGA